MLGSQTKFFENRRFLVCGGCGFMGSNFIHYVLDNFPGAVVANLDLLTYAGNEENLRGVPAQRYKFIKGDICDTALVKSLMREADFVVNFAAETHVDRSIHSDADDFVHTNVVGTHSLLKALRDSLNVIKMVHVSTDEVWGDTHLKSKERFNEETPLRPNSPYSASKAAGEMLVRSYHKTYGLPVVISRSANNFGPRQFPEKLIPFFTMLAMDNKPLPLHGSGANIREWIHVDDHTRAILTLLEKAPAGEIYGVSANEECANIDIAKKILKILDKSEHFITFVEDRPANDRRYAVNPAKLCALGWSPECSLNSHISHTVSWYLENKAWLANILQKYESTNKEMQRSSEGIRNTGLKNSRVKSLSVVLHCFNEKGTIATMALEGRRIARSLTNDFEIIVADDGSTDGSRELLLELQKNISELKLIFHEKKKGYGAALKSGFKMARKDFIFYTEGDGQYDMNDLPMLIDKLNDNIDFVTGYNIRNDPLHRIVIGAAYQRAIKWFFRIPIKDPDCEFRLMRRGVFDKIDLTHDSGVISVEMLKKAHNAGLSFAEAPVRHEFHAYGKSQALNMSRLFLVAWRLIRLWLETVLFKKTPKDTEEVI